ncbi:hypothetical protein ARMSODRAFT_1008406 [Armillaria solidipes]|uniref:Uncharacterized protein n=1 Tax=Armillaria solidipes TaxID=1076256 RepID=A0A2H3BG10_9AGAR|nr:hypothetical protein ARMSODRAFT_1008406 [Armillaria solidipes]
MFAQNLLQIFFLASSLAHEIFIWADMFAYIGAQFRLRRLPAKKCNNTDSADLQAPELSQFLSSAVSFLYQYRRDMVIDPRGGKLRGIIAGAAYHEIKYGGKSHNDFSLQPNRWLMFQAHKELSSECGRVKYPTFFPTDESFFDGRVAAGPDL